MRYYFNSEELRKLFLTGRGLSLHPNVARAFARTIRDIAAARDERDLRTIKGSRFEKLRGDRDGQYAIRLNIQYRVIFSIEHDEDGTYLLIIDVVDYH